MPSGRKNAILNPNVLWPNATIPYVISANFTCAQRQVVAFAINEYRKKTCIRFVPLTSEVNYIRIVKSGQGCWSHLGKIGGGQDLSLDDGCASNQKPSIVLHELMHAIGFEHEHQRPDRDKYVSINFNNVEKKNRGPLEKQSTAQVTTLELPYDYGKVVNRPISIREEIAETIDVKFTLGSVMHYPKHAFVINFSIPVIKALKGNPVLGQRAGFSTSP